MLSRRLKLQLWNVVQRGNWHASSIKYRSMLTFSDHRVAAPVGRPSAYHLSGAIPLVIATIKGWLGVRTDAAAERS